MILQAPTPELSDFDEVFRLHRGRIFRFMLMSLRDHDAAETLTQDCFLRAYRSRHTFRGDAQISTWLMKIAINLMRDHLRNRRRAFWRMVNTNSVELADVSDRIPDNRRTPEEILLFRAKVEALRQIVPRLSPQQREVFMMHFIDELQVSEIAESIGLKEGTVKSHLCRALRIVRHHLEQR